MDHFDRVATSFQTHIEAISLSVDAIASTAEYVAELATAALLDERKIIVIGAGADAATAMTFCEQLRKGWYRERPALPTVELIARTAEPQSAGVAWLAEQLQALGQAGDLPVVFCAALDLEEMESIATAAAMRGCEPVWLGSRGPGTSLDFPDSPAATRHLLNLAAASCLAELIDINTFGPLED